MTDRLVEHVLQALRTVLPNSGGVVGLHEPLFEGNEWSFVKECLDTGWVSSVGKYVDRFEQDLAQYTGARHVVAVVNGTSALHICLKLVGVEPEDEVLCPALTFVATANAIAYCGAIPHFVDSEKWTLGIDPQKLAGYLMEITERRPGGCFNRRTGRRIKALVPMHTFGHPVDLEPLVELCEHFGLELVEDAAESLGSFYKQRHTGTIGRIGALSFNGNKIITTGGGGAILTNDSELARKAKHVTTTAKVPHRWAYLHDEVGYNYRMPNLNAALGCAQIEQLERFVTWKRALAQSYAQAFHGLAGVAFFQEPPFARSNYWLNVLILDAKHAHLRDTLLETASLQGILMRPVWTLLHRLPMFKQCPRMDVSIAETFESRILNLPSSPMLGRSNA